jgi:hypothetical protein
MTWTSPQSQAPGNVAVNSGVDWPLVGVGADDVLVAGAAAPDGAKVLSTGKSQAGPWVRIAKADVEQLVEIRWRSEVDGLMATVLRLTSTGMAWVHTMNEEASSLDGWDGNPRDGWTKSVSLDNRQVEELRQPMRVRGDAARPGSGPATPPPAHPK